MPDPTPNHIREEFDALLHEALDALRPSGEDREALLRYGTGAAEAFVAVRLAGTPEEKEAALRRAQGFQDAISLVVARYEIKAGAAAEKALGRVVRRALALAVALL